MNLKIEVTKYVASQLGLETTENNLRLLKRKWWASTRIKDEGGLQLTEEGFMALHQADIKFHKITMENDIVFTNQKIIWLDNFITCPWFLANSHIFVFTESMAIQLVLFSGNIEKFLYSKAERAKLD
jgi:hypothetical protein